LFDSKLLDILCCPETHQRLHIAEAGILSSLNADIAASKVKNRAGQALSAPVAEALVSEDGVRLYPIVDGIPVMLLDESILLK